MYLIHRVIRGKHGMHVVVFGASGAIGRFLRPVLREAGIGLTAFSRQPQPDEVGVAWRQGALPDRVPPLPPADAIVCLGPLDHFAAWLDGADLPQRPRIVAMSSISARSGDDALFPDKLEAIERLREAENVLARVCAHRRQSWTVFRATLIYGDGTDRSITPLARRAMRWRVFPLPSACGLRQPVNARDLATAFLAVLQREGVEDGVLEIGGGERLSGRQMFARVRTSLPRWTLPLPVPRMALRMAARCVPALRGIVARLDQDLIADNRELEARLDVHPGPFRP